MTPAEINRELMKINNVGRCCIFTVVTGDYIWYLPMFIYMLKKAYPEYDLRILADTDNEVILMLPGVEKIKPFTGTDKGYRAAAERFLFSDAKLESYDYVFITDCDIMIIKEPNKLVDQHMLDLRKNDLDCYSNYTANEDRCPGVHFVTKDWWKKTADRRSAEKDKILASELIDYDHDEKMLRRIIVDSGLPTPPGKANLWAHHGEHLGTWRRGEPQIKNNVAISEMFADVAFMQTMEHCNLKAPSLRIKETFIKMKGHS